MARGLLEPHPEIEFCVGRFTVLPGAVYRLVSADQKRYNKYSEPTPAVTTLHKLSHDDTHNRPTQYEIVVVIDGKRVLGGYSAKKTKKALLTVALDNDDVRLQMLAALPADDASTPTYTARNGWVLGNSLIRWSGGTLRHPALSS